MKFSFVDFPQFGGIILGFRQGYVILPHPKRVANISAYRRLLIQLIRQQLKYVVLVDGATTEQTQLFDLKGVPPILSIHAKSGVYEGKEFDNTTAVEHISSSGEWVLMNGDAHLTSLLVGLGDRRSLPAANT